MLYYYFLGSHLLNLHVLLKSTSFRMDFLAGFIVVAAVSRTQRLALHSTFVFSFPLWKLPKLFFFSPLAFELFFHPRFVSLHCRHVSDIKTYVTITRQ